VPLKRVTMSTEVGYTPSGNRVTLEIEPRVEGPGAHVFLYGKDGSGTGFKWSMGRHRGRSRTTS
jgi:hypothetical protein